ncbi:MAG: PH domain-containing protein [Acidobacteria bacterium]|nr:PH domain-containing protein [Acidobacteriota bacterium]MCG3193481.1 hypothetical protein [Thermoanaerobaculia bacterium]MCK6685520.1 PH domain-containing protein [Thermoanaerobaculia bacterium]
MAELRQTVLRFLKIPERPHVPPGEEASCQTFRAGKGYYDYIRLGWGFGQAGALAGLLFGALFLHYVPGFGFLIRFGPWSVPVSTAVLSAIEFLAFAGYALQLPFTYFVLRLDYECRYYLLSDRSLRIQEGIWFFREQTFTLANIQQINVKQNPVQKLFGIADVVVSTAGGGGGQGPEGHSQEASLHSGNLRGVTGAEKIRDRLLAQMKRYKDSGLGQEPSHATGGPATARLENPEGLSRAIALTIAEIRALRSALEAGS